MRALILAVILLFAGTLALAAPDPKAVAHYKQGKAFLDAKQYDQAIAEFEAAYAIDKNASHLYNIGRAYDGMANFDKAIEYYNKYLDAAPQSKLAAEVRQLIATATQARADAAAKKKAEEDAAAKKKAEEEAARLAAEKKLQATAHVKQAEAYEKASAWADAGNEHKAAFAIDGDASHLLAAAAAFDKGHDLKATKDAYTAYLEKVPTGGDSDVVRGKLAETQKAIEKADEAERLRKAKEAQEQAERDRRLSEGNKGHREEPHRSFKRGWIVVGGALVLTGLLADLKGPNADNGKLDASDFAGPVLYGLGTLAVLRGVF